MFFRTYILLPLRHFWQQVLLPLLSAIDRFLVLFGGLFGANIPGHLRNTLVMQGTYLVIFTIALLFPGWISLVVLLYGYVGVLAVGRVWVANEKLRTRIARKLADDDPDKLPDLRFSAVLSACQLIVLFPLLLWQMQRMFGLFTVPEGANAWSWLAFTFEPSLSNPVIKVGRTLGFEVPEIYVGDNQTVGLRLMVLKRFTVDYILIQGIMRLFAISSTIKESVAALKTDPDMSRRLGHRAVEPLLDKLKDEDAQVRENAVTVLGQVGDDRAIEPLAKVLKHDPVATVRWRAADALAALKEPEAIEPLLAALNDSDLGVRTHAAQALVDLGARTALPALLTLLREGTPQARGAAIAALQGLTDPSTVEPLALAMRDPDPDVSRAAAAALGACGDARAVGPLSAVLIDKTSPEWLRYEAVKALGALGDPTAVPALSAVLQDSDEFLRKLAVTALGSFKEPDAIAALKQALQDADEKVRERAAEALGVEVPG
jgi:HEAT repeat protein